MTTNAQRVDNGIAHLDRWIGPGWVWDIDLKTLDLESSCNCVLGQLAIEKQLIEEDSPWARVLQVFGILGSTRNSRSSTDVSLGFNARWRRGVLFPQRAYDNLTAEWRRRITELRAERPRGS